MISKLFSTTALSLLAMSGSYFAAAQTFVPPVAHEQAYNNWDIYQSKDISCFSFQDRITNTAWGDVDVYLAAFGSGFGEVTVQFTSPADPTNVLYHGNLSGLQGNYNYQDGSYLQVGAVYNESTGRVQVLVAYQWAGFKVDIFDITNSSTDPVVYNSTINLTNQTLSFFDHRIRMDSDSKDLSRVAIVWDNPTVGLQTIGCEYGNWGNIMDIDNTYGAVGPDIALSHTTTPEHYLHYVYHDASGTVISKSIMAFADLMDPFATMVTPSVEDINFLSTPVNSNLVIDSKDEDDSKSWAYTYTDQNASEVFVRLVENNSGTPPTTVGVNTGALGNASINSQYNAYSPSLNYGSRGAKEDEITVGWYNTDGSYNGYIGLIMSPDGSALISDADYLEMPNAFTAAPYPNTASSGIAFSKADADHTANRHLYTVYYDRVTSYSDQLHHAYHLRGFTAFKENKKMEPARLTIYPNPFSDVLNTAVTLKEAGSVRLDLIDIAGRVVKQQEFKAETGTYPVQMSGLGTIVPGTYFLKTSIAGKSINTQTVIKK
ncbi:MAG: T9SS type A sorting domain-containing protein [Taibaiella sp.]|nr:T9SS type A sorting domain-containing protein [Taibaiella sp.]